MCCRLLCLNGGEANSFFQASQSAPPVITSVDVLPVPVPATKATSWPVANASRAAFCSAVALKATPHVFSTRTASQFPRSALAPAERDQLGSAH